MQTFIHKDAQGDIEVFEQTFYPKENTDKTFAVVYLPGWEIGVNSVAVRKLCEDIAQTTGFCVYAFSTRPEFLSADSLKKEAEAIFSLLATRVKEKNIILAAHSQGTIKSIYLTQLLETKSSSFSLKGLLVATPVGLYPVAPHRFTAHFLREVTKVLSTSGKELLLQHEEKNATHLARSVFSYLKEDFTDDSWNKLRKRLLSHAEELVNASDKALLTLQQLQTPITFILADRDGISSPFHIRDALYKHRLHKIKLIQIENTSHGLPYYHTHIVAEEIKKMI